MNTLKPNAQRARNAILMIWIVTVIAILSLLSSFIQYGLLLDMQNGQTVSMDDADINDIREGFILLLYLIAYIISGVTFIMWFRRAYFNLHQRVNHLAHSEEWAVIGWFVPVINFFRPYTIMDELSKETQEYLNLHQIRTPRKQNQALIGWWWALWIITGVLAYINKDSGIMEEVLTGAITQEKLMGDTMLDILTSVLEIPLAVITVNVIKQYAAIEPLLNEVPVEEPQSEPQQIVAANSKDVL